MKNYKKHWQILVTFMLVGGFVLSPAIAAAAGTIAYEQSPGHFGGFLSDGQVFAVADEFQLGQSQLISEITWWGGYASTNLPAPSSDNFTIHLFSDTGGAPGTLLQSFHVGNNALRTATGDFVNPPDPFSGFEGRPEFKYSFNLPTAVQAAANTRYWLTIINAPSSDSWVWEVSASLVNLGVQRSFEGGPWEPYFDNTAFQLQAVEDTPTLLVGIDIKPGGTPNSISLRNNGVIPVAILSSPTFNAPSQVDKSSLTFGKNGNEPSLAKCSSESEDVNGDGLLDLVCAFSAQAAGFQSGDTEGKLKGETVTSQFISGTDSVRIVP